MSLRAASCGGARTGPPEAGSARVLAAVAGVGAAQLAGHLSWGHPLLFTLISGCGYAACAVCISVAMVIGNRSARGTGGRTCRSNLTVTSYARSDLG